MQGDWYEFEVIRDRQRDLLGEAESRRLARAARPERIARYRRLLSRFTERIQGLGRRVSPSRRAFPLEAEVAGPGLVEAIFEESARPLRSSSVIELRREGQGYVIREVNLSTGDDVLYLSTREPEWAAWIWERKTRG
jgi:hypothetical protein